MTSIRNIAPSTLIVAVSCLIGIFAIELAWKLLGGSRSYDDDRYPMFAQAGGGEVFHNDRDFFVYVPGQTMTSAGYFDVHARWIREYDSTYRTNNFGLVQ